MGKSAFLAIFTVAGLLRAQNGQAGPRPEWPCVPGRGIDPAYLETSESTGGQVFLFQKNEVALSGEAMTASYTHPATVLRAIGEMSGTRDFDFPVDSSIESLMVLVSLQCRSAIQVSQPGGIEVTDRNSAVSVELKAGRILRVTRPAAGPWHIRLAGSGVFILAVLAKSNIAIRDIEFSTADDASVRRTALLGVPQTVHVRISGELSDVRSALVDAGGTPLSEFEIAPPGDGGSYRSKLTPTAERFRILVVGTDSQALPLQRMYPVLFRAGAPPQ